MKRGICESIFYFWSTIMFRLQKLSRNWPRPRRCYQASVQPTKTLQGRLWREWQSSGEAPSLVVFGQTCRFFGLAWDLSEQVQYRCRIHVQRFLNQTIDSGPMSVQIWWFVSCLTIRSEPKLTQEPLTRLADCGTFFWVPFCIFWTCFDKEPGHTWN